MAIYEPLFFLVKLLFVYLTFLIKYKTYTSVVFFISVVLMLLLNISISKISFLLVLFVMPFVLYSTITHLLSVNAAYPQFKNWEKEHVRIRFYELREFWVLLGTCFLLMFGKEILLASCNIQEMRSIIGGLEQRVEIINMTSIKGLEALAKADLKAVSNYLITIKNVSDSCKSCIDLTVCSSFKDFMEHVSESYTAHAASNKPVIDETTQKRACTEILALLRESLQNNNSDHAKQLAELTKDVCKEPSKQPWFSISGPVFSTKTGTKD